MEDFAFGAGVLLAIAGPVLIIPLVWLVHRLLARPLLRALLSPDSGGQLAGWLGLALSTLLVAAVLAGSYLPGKRAFDHLCSQHATPRVLERARAEGFFRNRLYPYETRRFLDEHGFRFVEGPDLYQAGAYVRYSKDPAGETVTQRLAGPESRYGVKETHSVLAHGILMTEKRVHEMQTGRELARAAQVVYEGGPLSLFLGVYAMSSCPDVRTAAGSEHFMTFYNLETVVLRAPDSRAGKTVNSDERD